MAATEINTIHQIKSVRKRGREREPHGVLFFVSIKDTWQGVA